MESGGGVRVRELGLGVEGRRAGMEGSEGGRAWRGW